MSNQMLYIITIFLSFYYQTYSKKILCEANYFFLLIVITYNFVFVNLFGYIITSLVLVPEFGMFNLTVNYPKSSYITS